MTVFTEEAHAAEFILSEAQGMRSRDNGTLAGGQDLAAGTILAKPTGEELVAWTGAEFTDGVEDEPVGILIYPTNTSSTGLNAATSVAYIARDAEVNKNLITHTGVTQAFAISKLKTILGIIAR